MKKRYKLIGKFLRESFRQSKIKSMVLMEPVVQWQQDVQQELIL